MALITIPGLLVVAGAAAFGAYGSWASSTAIAPGVLIAGEDVGGLTKSEAQQRLESRFGRLFIEIQTDERPFRMSLTELGGRPQVAYAVNRAFQVGRQHGTLQNFWRVYGSKARGERLPLPVTWEKNQLVSKLRIINRLYSVKPQDARLSVGVQGVTVLAEKTGKRLNVGETALQLQKKYYVGLPALEGVTEVVEPKVTRASLAGTDVKLAEYKTRYNPGDVGRTKNVHTAAAAVDGRVVAPGEVFSFNASTGKRTAEKGYRMAHIFVRQPGQEESEIVDGLAGGTCQVSSTLYNAVRRLNEKIPGATRIVERNHHSLPVTYVPAGLDATVAWPSLDFRFRNTSPYPIYIRAKAGDATLRVSVWGRVPESGVPTPARSGAELAAAPEGEKSTEGGSRRSDGSPDA